MASEEAADWRVGLTTLQRFSYMFDGQYARDETFIVGEGEKQEKVHCHRLPLKAGSAVFEHQLENKDLHEITLPDAEPSGFKALIKFLYGGELDINAHNVMPLMYAANKYSIIEVTEKCGDFLAKQIQVDSVCTLLEASIKYNENKLTERCMKFICTHAPEVLSSQDFIELSIEALLKIVESDDLFVTERDLYNACVKWADAECVRRGIEAVDDKKREVLGDVLYRIRFPNMSQQEFAEISSQSELLTLYERVKIYYHIILHNDDRFNCHCTFKFDKKPRPATREVTVSRFSDANILHGQGTLTTNGYVMAVDFQCNKSCFLQAASVFGGDTPCDRYVSVKLLDSAGTVVSSTNKQVVTDGTKTPVRVDFPHPIAIHVGTRYSVVTSVDGTSYIYYGRNGSLSIDNYNFNVTFHASSHGTIHNQYDSWSGQANWGQIPELYFKVQPT